MNIAVLLMAGSSQRLNSKVPKQFIEINNKKVYQYCLDNFNKIKTIDKIVLVTNEPWIKTVQYELSQTNYDLNKVHVISGGNTRTASLKQALDYMNKNQWTGNIITHDVARALVSSEIINQHLSEIQQDNNAIINTYLESTDSLSTISNGQLTILDRSKIIRHQTPQTITLNNLNKAFANLSEEQWNIKTDLCDLCSSLNLKVINLLGNNENFKITTMTDLDFFEYYVNNKKI